MSLSHEALIELARELRNELRMQIRHSPYENDTAWNLIEWFDAEYSQESVKQDGVNN